jgi:hypothetical protein
MCLTNSTKLEMNLLRKLIFPRKIEPLSWIWEKIRDWMASTLLGSILTPSSYTPSPNNLPSFIANKYLLGLSDNPNFLHFRKMLASEVTPGLQQEQSPTPISLCHDLFIKGDRKRADSE